MPLLEPKLPLFTADAFLKKYKTEKRRKRMRGQYEAMITAVQTHAAPKAIYDEFSLKELSELGEHFKPETVSAVLAVCTLGAELDAYQQQLGAADIVAAAICEEVALAAVVALTNQVHAGVREQMGKRGLKAGPAYRPGIGRWPLEAQEIIFSLLPAAEVGVTLSEFIVMTPRMTTTLIIPILDRRL